MEQRLTKDTVHQLRVVKARMDMKEMAETLVGDSIDKVNKDDPTGKTFAMMCEPKKHQIYTDAMEEILAKNHDIKVDKSDISKVWAERGEALLERRQFNFSPEVEEAVKSRLKGIAQKAETDRADAISGHKKTRMMGHAQKGVSLATSSVDRVMHGDYMGFVQSLVNSVASAAVESVQGSFSLSKNLKTIDRNASEESANVIKDAMAPKTDMGSMMTNMGPGESALGGVGAGAGKVAGAKAAVAKAGIEAVKGVVDIAKGGKAKIPGMPSMEPPTAPTRPEPGR